MIIGVFIVVISLCLNLSERYFLAEMLRLFILIIFFLAMIFHQVNYELVRRWFFFDRLRYIIVVLRAVIRCLLLAARYHSVIFSKKNLNLFIQIRVFMLLFLILAFLRVKPIGFYIYFEASLVPIFLIIIGWGYQPERLQAAIYILFYTLFASLPLLIVILINHWVFSRFSYLGSRIENGLLNKIVRFIFIFAFLVKLPIFFIHLWLPKAHVEAPVAGSMILAGVLLKLGGYGLWRVFCFLVKNLRELRVRLMTIGLIGGVIVRFVCFLQIDIKCLVAYSSVVHIGILLRGLRTLRFRGFKGALCLIVGHGVVSSGLFYLVGLNYDRFSSRRLLINKGLIILFPSVTVIWFFLRVFNIRAPPSVSLLGEIILSSRILSFDGFIFWALIIINFLGMVFTFFLYAQRQQGKRIKILNRISLISVREYFIGWAHVGLMFFMVEVFWLF